MKIYDQPLPMIGRRQFLYLVDATYKMREPFGVIMVIKDGQRYRHVTVNDLVIIGYTRTIRRVRIMNNARKGKRA